MARGDQIQRHWNLLRSLQTRGQGLSLRDLAGELNVAERTIQRDFEILDELGFPIDHDEDEYGRRYWRMPHDYFRSGALVLGLTEAVSLHLAENLFAPLAGTHFAEGLQTILNKIRSLIPAKALDYFKELDETIHVRRIGVTDYSAHAETIRVVSEAARDRRSIEVTYRAVWRGAAYTTLYDPYGLVYYDGDLFLVGRSHRAEALRIFKVTRITSANLTAQAFERPTDFRLEEHFRSAFGIVQAGGEPVEITVRFRGPVAALIKERIWHESQKLEWLPAEQTFVEPQPDDPGVLLATFRLANLVEFKRWLKGFGEHAEVLSPESLRQEMHEELLAAARQYGSGV